MPPVGSFMFLSLHTIKFTRTLFFRLADYFCAWSLWIQYTPV